MSRAAIILLALLAACGELAKSDVNPPEGYSGLSVLVDAKTSCEYLTPMGSKGGLTPRMGADGKQICRQGAKP